MNAGDTLIVPQPTEGVDGHLWVIVSDPSQDADRLVIVSFTTYGRYKDQTCAVRPGDHPFVTRDTLVCYSDARIATNAQLELLVTKGLMKRNKPVSAELLERIRQGAWKSDEISLEAREVLVDQGMIG